VYRLLKKLAAATVSAKVTERFETPPGQQTQFDWSPYTIELCLRHFGGAPKQLVVDNAKAFVLDANPTHFRWNPQFLELCGHYRMRPSACQPYRPRTKGKVERPFFYLEQQFIKGTRFASLSHFLEELASFEHDDLDVRVHTTTQERPIDRFERELQHLTPLPGQPFVGTLAMSRKVSWDCLVSYQSKRYSVPATYAGKMVWLLPSRGSHLVVLDAKRDVLAEHQLSPTKGTIVMRPEHYAPLRRGTARTYVVLAEQFLKQFPQRSAFLEGLLAQHKLDPARHRHGIMELASLYDAASLERALLVATEYNTYSHTFVRGVLEHKAAPRVEGSEITPQRSLPVTVVQPDLSRYQRVLEVAR
jgi:Mu transposase-like protein